MVVGKIVHDPHQLGPWLSRWDALAVTSRLPYCAPAWMLAWWRHAAPPYSQLRVVTVTNEGELLGVAPFFLEQGLGRLNRYRLLGPRNSTPRDLLARPGAEKQVAAAIATTIATAEQRPHLVLLDGIRSDSRWPEWLAQAWPCRVAPAQHTAGSDTAPTLEVRGTFEQWLASKSSNFRQQMRRHRRQLERRGAVFRLATSAEDIERGLRAFSLLHHSRWSGRGGSARLNQGIELMLREAAKALLGHVRFRLWSIEVDGKVISSQIFVAAGGELAYWLGGFDDAWAAQQPALQTILAAIQHAWEVGDTRISLGGGGQEYKYRFADGHDVVEAISLVPFGLRYPITQAQLVAVARISPRARERLKGVLKAGPHITTVKKN